MSPPATAPSSRCPWFFGAALVAAIAAAYAPSLRGGFLWDDDLHITANPTIVGPLGLKEIWTTARANYFPLTLTNFWVQHALWGVEPLGYRVVTLAFHALAAVLLWRVLLRLRVPPAGAWLGAALWALHPVQVESVAWICELKNTQSAVFFLAAILAWLAFVGRGSSPASSAIMSGPKPDAPPSLAYAVALVCALLAILSKPSTVTLPVALGLVAWWQRGRVGWRDCLLLAPFFALSAVAAGWTIWEQKFNSGAIGPEWAQTFPQRLALAGRAVWFYLGKLAWPEPLVFIYPRWTLAAGLDPGHFGLLAVAGVLALFVARQWRAATVAALFFGALLFPVLGFFSVYFFRYSFVGDHFQYLASMGPLALLGAGLAQLPRRYALGAGGALVAACLMLTLRQTPAYRNNEALWRHTLARNPGAFMAWANLGDTLRLAQRPAEAMEAYRSALALRPGDAPVLNDLGNLLVLDGRLGEALPLLERAVAARPAMADFRLSLGNALRDLGRVAEAIAEFRRALELEPSHGPAHNNLAIELAKAGDNAGAATHFEAALRAWPGHSPTRDNLVRALIRLSAEHATASRWSAAADAARRAVAHAPADASAHAVLAAMLAQDGRLTESLPVFETAVRLAPQEAEARENFGRVLGALGRHREASAQLEEAARLRRAGAR